MLDRGSELFQDSQTYIDPQEPLQILSSADSFEVDAVETSLERHTYKAGVGVQIEDADTAGHNATSALGVLGYHCQHYP